MVQPCAAALSLSLFPSSLKRDGEIKTKGRRREEERRRKERSFLVHESPCFPRVHLVHGTIYVHTRASTVQTRIHTLCALSRIRSRVRVRNQFPLPPPLFFFSLHLFLPFYTTVCLFLVPDTRPTCKSCRDLVYLRDSRFPTTGVFPPKLDRPLSGRFFSVFLLLFLFFSLFLVGYSFGFLLVWGEKLIERSIIMSFFLSVW